ncbi:MAG TPA: acyclic terpene utilization AtuA family protein, partial [Caulobacteraceae bacterium]|nr:acyclic terpene utilization AtuA family protein [Caulobacteraceae bacterium]
FDPRLEERMRAVLPAARRSGARIITNMGAANPAAAAGKVAEIARDLGLEGLRVAAVLGDDVLSAVQVADLAFVDRPGRVSDLGDRVISANAYLGAWPIAEALDQGADVVVTGRVCDAALFLAPMIHRFGWAVDDWTRLGRGTVVGHLLECAGQLTGGYFADPGVKDIPALARLGFPFADVSANGDAVLGKLPDTGGRLSAATCSEQLLYEVIDPATYLQADVTADFSGVRFQEIAPDRIAVSGAGGAPRPATVKVSVGYHDGFMGEGQISYAGLGAAARGRLAIDIVRERLKQTGVEVDALDCTLIGLDSVDRRPVRPEDEAAAREVRARIAARASSALAADRIGAEVEALYTNGPAGGGGVTRRMSEVIAIGSVLLPREQVSASVQLWE